MLEVIKITYLDTTKMFKREGIKITNALINRLRKHPKLEYNYGKLELNLVKLVVFSYGSCSKKPFIRKVF